MRLARRFMLHRGGMSVLHHSLKPQLTFFQRYQPESFEDVKLNRDCRLGCLVRLLMAHGTTT